MTATPGWEQSTNDLAFGVTFAGLRFETDRGGRDAPWVLTLSSLEGWWEPAPDLTDSIDHPSGSGTLPLLGRSGPRTIELRGLILGRTMGDVLAAKSAITRSSAGPVLVDERASGVPRVTDARRVGVSFTTRSPTISTYVLTLLADDPFRFGTGSIDKASGRFVNGVVRIPNRGNVAVQPVLDLTGPHSALTIQHPGGSYGLQAVPAGQSRTLDFRNGDVWNGNVRVFNVESGRRPTVLPGGSAWTVSGLGSGGATLRRFEAWM